MQTESVKIKVLVAAGVAVPDAIKAALGRAGLSRFARERRFARPNVSQCIHGTQKHERIRDALAPALGVDREWLDTHLDALTPAAEAAR